MDEQFLLLDVVTQGNDLWIQTIQPDPLVAVRTKDQWSSFLKDEKLISLYGAGSDGIKGLVVKNHAVLKDLDEGSTLMCLGRLEGVNHVLHVSVQGAGHKSGLGTESEEKRIYGVVYGPQRSALGFLPNFRSGAVLSFGQAIDTVVEEKNVYVQVAPEQVKKMIGSDGKSVPVTRDHPYGQFRVCHLHARRDGGSSTMNGMETVGVHVVGKTAAAPDPAHDHELLTGNAKLGQGPLYCIKNRIVSTTRAPANVVGRHEVLLGQASLISTCSAH